MSGTDRMSHFFCRCLWLVKWRHVDKTYVNWCVFLFVDISNDRLVSPHGDWINAQWLCVFSQLLSECDWESRESWLISTLEILIKCIQLFLLTILTLTKDFWCLNWTKQPSDSVTHVHIIVTTMRTITYIHPFLDPQNSNVVFNKMCDMKNVCSSS